MSDLISRQAAIDAVDSETVSTNPEHFKSSEKFIEFMDDTDIASVQTAPADIVKRSAWR